MAKPVEHLFDTTAVSDIYRGRAALKERFDAILSGEDLPFVSAITQAELWRGLRPEELEKHELRQEQFVTLPIDADVARLAGAWMREYESTGLGWMDALIVATATAAELPVLACDKKLALVLGVVAHFDLYEV